MAKILFSLIQKLIISPFKLHDYIFQREIKITRIVDYIFEYANKSTNNLSRKNVCRNIARKLQAFSEEYHYDLFTNSLNIEISEEFIHYLKKLNLRPVTIKAIVAKLVRILHIAEKSGFQVDYSIEEINVVSEEPCTIYLNEIEIKSLIDMKLKKEAAIIRDIFVIGCYTGLRYSDLIRLTKDNCIGGIIRSTSLKTRITSEIPIHPLILSILEKYDYTFTRQGSSQNYNQMIKKICKKAGIVEPILLEYTLGFKRIKKKVPKYSLVSSHTARRSLATNMYLAGETLFRIMLITGHKTEESFFRYIRISRSENAKELKKNGFFTGESLLSLQKEK